MSKENKRWLIVGFMALFLMLALTCLGFTDDTGTQDVYFTYNRALQMLNCIRDGRVPWFFYNDFNGAGYGSPFFYGQLTLYPFLPFVSYGYQAFVKAYMMASWALLFWGLVTFYKRFREDYSFFAVLTLFSTFLMEMYGDYLIFQSVLAIGISFVFLAYCVDFFRDGRGFLKASVAFFILLNSHMLTSFFAFVGCCLIMMLYFNKARISDYVKFAAVTCLLCSYNVLNLLWHSDILTSVDNISEQGIARTTVNHIAFLTRFPVGGAFDCLRYTPNDFGLCLVNYTTFGFMLYGLIKAKKSPRSLFVLLVCIVGVILGYPRVLLILGEFVNTFWQSPRRYLVYIVVALFLVCFNNVTLRRWCKVLLFVSLIPCMCLFCALSVITSADVDFDSEKFKISASVISGEFLDESFVFDIDQFMQLSSQTGFTVNKDEISYEASGEETVRFPKLYYRGYKAWTEDGTELPVEMGYSQFINVKTSGYKGEVTLKYCHPIWLQVLGTICYLIFDVTLVYLVWRSEFFRRFRRHRADEIVTSSVGV